MEVLGLDLYKIIPHFCETWWSEVGKNEETTSSFSLTVSSENAYSFLIDEKGKTVQVFKQTLKKGNPSLIRKRISTSYRSA